ncbi:sulfotransferase [Qipengyuania aquimaris]|uniref:sulfotransferase n=1 Tax=Qipengyuania aquimaris TaxID=255984 RepID=UPI001FD5924C|nr:sulfotransferase [Qipengyuania aquimaris]UOR14853.1 sulfotransferase [Qipengyuania aquimaris]
MTIRIAMWSGPRNISTAMMRSFGSRADCAVSDEPFYGAFLKATGEPHPLARETIESMDCDWHTVLRQQSGDAPSGEPVWYQKHMPHHMVGPVSIAAFGDHLHAFLIRAPERVVASYRKKNELRRAEMLGFAQMRSYFDFECERSGTVPPVVDSDDILADPEGVLTRLCEALGIDWDPAMLAWQKGPQPEDGVWGTHWYDRVNASTGFGAPPGDLPELEGEYLHVAEECRDDYEALARYRIST